MVDNGEGECDAFRRRLGGVFDVRDPAVVFGEELMARKERRGVAVGADAEEDEVKDGKTRRVLLREFVDELLLVRVGELLEVVRERVIDGVDVVARDGDLGEELVRAEEMIGVGVVERHDALIGVEDLPAIWSDDGPRYINATYIPFIPFHTGSVDERVKLLGEGAAGESDGELALLFDRLFLRLDDEVGKGVAKLCG